MTTPTGAMLYTQGYGSRPENVEIPVYSQRDPLPADYLYPLGKRWINRSGNTEFSLVSFSTTNNQMSANWQNLVSSDVSGAINQLVPNGGTNPVLPVDGSISLLGDSLNISTIGSSGSIAVILNSDLSVNEIDFVSTGSLISISDKSTNTACCGSAQLTTGGTVTITTSACTTSSLIFLTVTLPEGELGLITVSEINNGNFVVASQAEGDQSVFNYLIIN